MKIAAGANYHHKNSPHNPIPIYNKTELIEGGIHEYCNWNYTLPFSLHIARSPVTESKKNQLYFVEVLTNKLLCYDKIKPISVGIHLSGPRNEGIGRFGFTTSFNTSNSSIKSASDFVLMLSEKLNMPVWIENANFYEESVSNLRSAWQSMNKIAEDTNSKFIVDLPHLLISAKNLSFPPEIILDWINWDFVSEIHLSGSKQGSDGTLHDSHSSPVTEKVWELFDIATTNYLENQSDVYVNIEHTDPEWVNDIDGYVRDFKILDEKIISSKSIVKKTTKNNEFIYAQSYLKKIIWRQIPKIEDYCKRFEVNSSLLFNKWFLTLKNSDVNQYVLSKEEVTLFPKNLKPQYIAEDFAKFLERECLNENRY